MIKSLTGGAILLVAASSLAFGQTAAPKSSTSSPMTTTASPGDMKASSLIGLNINNRENQKIGEINDVLVGSNGKVDKVIVSVGGFLGIGDKHVAIAWDDLKLDTAKQVASVNMSKDQLKAAPEYIAPARTSILPMGGAAGTKGTP